MDRGADPSEENEAWQLSCLREKVKATIVEQITVRNSDQCHYSHLEFTCGHSYHHPELPYPSHSLSCGGNLMTCTPLSLPHVPIPVDSECSECILKPKKDSSEDENLGRLFGLLVDTGATVLPTKSPEEGLSREKYLAKTEDTANLLRDALESSITSSGESGSREVAGSEKHSGVKGNQTEGLGEQESEIVVVDMIDDSMLEARTADLEANIAAKEEQFVLLEADQEDKEGIDGKGLHMREISL